MKILLFGEYSNVHATLARGLRRLGHEVTVVSDGDRWKAYPRDIDITRRGTGVFATLRYLWKVWRVVHSLRGYDVVQIINPMMLELKAERQMWAYRMLRRNNKRMVMGAFGMDHYWVKAGCDCHTFRYSDFNMGSELRIYPMGETEKRDWLEGAKGRLNRLIANDCDLIVTGLYEYDASYRPHFPQKTHFIPMPIELPDESLCAPIYDGGKIRFFIGIQRTRSEYKGTDIMLRALRRLEQDYGERIEVRVAENVPFEEYKRMLGTSHVILDQLYSYTPAMNALLAMSCGMIVVGGGEPENYDILGESELRPIINVQPSEDDVYCQIRDRIILHPENVATLQRQSRLYVERHHEYVQIAMRWMDMVENTDDHGVKQTQEGA